MRDNSITTAAKADPRAFAPPLHRTSLATEPRRLSLAVRERRDAGCSSASMSAQAAAMTVTLVGVDVGAPVGEAVGVLVLFLVLVLLVLLHTTS